MANYDFSDFDQALKQVNLKLKDAHLRVAIERKGMSLYVRAVLPPPPDSDKTSHYQQHLPLRLKANSIGLQRAKAEAHKIGAALALKEFTWTDYVQVKNKVEKQTVADWIAAFKTSYFENIERNATTERSFKTGYGDYLKRLPQSQAPTRELLERAIKATKPNSCTRFKICIAYQRFGTFVGINVNFINKKIRGTYSYLKSAPRDLPSDELIVEYWNRIANPKWQWVYGMLATFGLRPHEVFHLDTQELEQGGYTLKVLEDTKTGYREVLPLHPEWVDQFGLRHKQLPKVTSRNNADLGQRVGNAFGRYHIPFPAYNLRHSYAVRCIEFDINVSLAARWMGHSVMIHTRTYQAWLSKAVEQRAFERALKNPNRPQPPIVYAFTKENKQVELISP